MKILCQEHFKEVQKYAKEINDSSLSQCLKQLKSWENNPDRPCEIELHWDFAPYSFLFTQIYPDGSIGLSGGLIYHGNPDMSFSVTFDTSRKWQIHT